MSEPPKLTGKIIVISDTQFFASGFQKREFVVETFEKYPQPIKFDAIKEGCDRLDAYQVGDKITVSYNLRGNEYNGKYYVSLQAWKFNREGQAASPPPASSHQQAKSNAYAPPAPAPAEDDDDDIPF